MILLSCTVVVRLKYANTFKELRQAGMYEDLNKYWYYSHIFNTNVITSNSRFVLDVRIRTAKGFSTVPSSKSVCFPEGCRSAFS